MKYDFISGTPINKTAGAVVSSGTHFEPKIKPGSRANWEINPAIGLYQRIPRAVIDITGMRRGRLVAVNYFGSRKSGGSMWVVRCDCGRFEVRYGKKFRENNNKNDMCLYCDKVRHLGSEYHSRKAKTFREFGYK